MIKKKGQVGFEFMMVALIAISTLIVFVIILSVLTTTKQDDARMFKAQSLVDGFSEELFFAAEAEEGYSRVIELPSSVEGRPYVLNIEGFENRSSFFELSVESYILSNYLPSNVQSFYFNSSIHSKNVVISKRDGLINLEVVS
ncbi:MAG: hypothetical protein ACLFN8_01390 [Candidatus Woesearchaeota archaeon]